MKNYEISVKEDEEVVFEELVEARNIYMALHKAELRKSWRNG